MKLNRLDVLKAHKLHPEWTSKQIAIALLGIDASPDRIRCADGWVRETARRSNIILGKVQSKQPKPPKPRRESLAALGAAARARGLTVKAIFQIGCAYCYVPAESAVPHVE